MRVAFIFFFSFYIMEMIISDQFKQLKVFVGPDHFTELKIVETYPMFCKHIP